jgi:murein DD-endopeptidase MepM/ murein hydrolase activator NlpD
MFTKLLVIIAILFMPLSSMLAELEIEQEEIETRLFIAEQRYTTGSYEPAKIKKIQWLFQPELSYPVENVIVSSGFGNRDSSCPHCSTYHLGVDFTPGKGTPVMAAADGIIVDMGYSSAGFGNYILIKHVMPFESGTQEWVTVYAHLQDKSFVEDLRVGSVVKASEKIARVGNTGTSTGPHLHFEIRIDGNHVNPMPLLQKYAS